MASIRDFSGKVAVVTGGGSGMGRAAAERLAAAGAFVVVADIDERAAKEVAESAGSGVGVRVDVRFEEDVRRLFQQVASERGRLDLLFNNAGLLGPAGPIAEASGADFDHIFGVNARGSFLCLSAALGIMIAQRSGAIVSTASIAGLRGVANVGLYAASKFAVIGLTRSAAKEGGPFGVRVNAICPGPTETNFSTMSEEIIAASRAAIPLGRIASADDMARAALWLLSDDASFVNGAVLPVDGGQTA